MSKTATKNLTPQTPGAPSAPAAEPAGEVQIIAEPVVAASNEQGGNGETVTVKLADLNALLSRVESLERQRTPAAKVANPEAALPDQSEVDPNKIETAVLTKQGWVVPKEKPHPAAPRAF